MNQHGDSWKENFRAIVTKPLIRLRGWLLSHTLRVTSGAAAEPTTTRGKPYRLQKALCGSVCGVIGLFLPIGPRAAPASCTTGHPRRRFSGKRRVAVNKRSPWQDAALTERQKLGATGSSQPVVDFFGALDFFGLAVAGLMLSGLRVAMGAASGSGALK
jgi:hypothetical protein